MVEIDIRRAIDLQKKLSEKVLLELNSFRSIELNKVKYVVGVDAAYNRDLMVGVAVAIDFENRHLLTYSVVKKKTPMNYIPGLLAFREAPAYIAAIKKLPIRPDVIFVDGHGLSHPRALGIATHIGLVLDKPTVGIAKKRLYGEIVEDRGKKYVIAHGHRVAQIIVHKGKELYVSIGYKISLESAVRITVYLLDQKHKLPLPIALADNFSKRLAKRP